MTKKPSRVMKAHYHYEVLTPHEQKVVDFAYARLAEALGMNSLEIAAGEHSNRVIDEIARAVLANNPLQFEAVSVGDGLWSVQVVGGEQFVECGSFDDAAALVALRRRLTGKPLAAVS